jgi:hypothetical protein
MTKRDDAIQMSVGGLTLDPVTKTPIVILKDTDNKLNLPNWRPQPWRRKSKESKWPAQ